MKFLYSKSVPGVGLSRRLKCRLACFVLTCSLMGVSQAAELGAYMVQPASAEINSVAIGGTVIPFRSVVVSAQRGGRITQLYAREGSLLKFNQPIAALDDDVLRQQISGLEAEIEAAQSTLNYAIYAPDTAGSGMPGGVMGGMFSTMFGMPGGGSGVNEWLNRVNRIDQARARIKTLEAQKKALEAQVNYGAVTAPMDGIVTDRLVEAGEVVQAGEPLIKLAYVNQLRAEFDVPVDLAGEIAPGRSVFVKTAQGVMLPAPISEIAPAVDARTHTQRIKLDLPPGSGLRLGDYVELLLPRSLRADALGQGAVMIPARALMQGSALPMVRVIQGDGVLANRIVRVAQKLANGMVLVSSGLIVGEIVQVQP